MIDAIKFDGEEYLPCQVTEILISSGKLDEWSSGQILDGLKKVKSIYEQARKEDEEEIKKAGGIEKWYDNVLDKTGHAEHWQKDNWDIYGPQNWRKAVNEAKNIFGGKTNSGRAHNNYGRYMPPYFTDQDKQ